MVKHLIKYLMDLLSFHKAHNLGLWGQYTFYDMDWSADDSDKMFIWILLVRNAFALDQIKHF